MIVFQRSIPNLLFAARFRYSQCLARALYFSRPSPEDEQSELAFLVQRGRNRTQIHTFSPTTATTVVASKCSDIDTDVEDSETRITASIIIAIEFTYNG